MRLDRLIAGYPELHGVSGSRTPMIAGLTCDSRKVGRGDLFVAIKGERADGSAFIGEALRRGAVAVAAGREAAAQNANGAAAFVEIGDPRRFLSWAAARFHAPQPRRCVMITGTGGKTSVAVMTRRLHRLCGRRAAAIGTLGALGGEPGGEGIEDESAADRGADAAGVAVAGVSSSLTTPDAVDLHRLLAAFKAQGIDDVAVEASSHGLHQRRLDGVEPIAAAFTNLGRDHLDYHRDRRAYAAAKLRLFEELTPPGAVAAIVDSGDEASRLFRRAALRRGLRLRRLCLEGLEGAASAARGNAASAAGGGGANDGADAEKEIRIAIASDEGGAANDERGGRQRLAIARDGVVHRVDFPLPGAFQALNAVLAAELVLAADPAADAADVYALSARLSPVRGRLERVGERRGGAVFVDYAHKPEALQNALTALRPMTKGQLIVVFGCGGERDAGKRPIMGAIAARLADRTIICDDNPRREDAAAIRAAIRIGAPEADIIPDRRAAIAAALGDLDDGDVALIAGKGHETVQIVGDRRLPFDDRLVAASLLSDLEG